MTTPIPAGWKPISSAPKDGSLILLGCADEGPDGRPALCLPGYWLKGWCDATDDMGQDDGWVDAQHTDFYPGRSFGSPDYMRKGSQPTHWMPLPAAPGSPASTQTDDRDWELTCEGCDGDGFVYVERRVGPCQTDIQTFKEECECCEGRGFTIAFEDIPGIAEYVKSCRAPSAPGDAQDERQAFEAWMTSQGQGFLRDGDSYSLTYARRAWDAWQARARIDAPAAGDALDLTLAQKYEDACIAANANARDAERWRKAVSQWRINRVEVFDGITLSNAKGINWDDLTRQVDAALAAQVPQQGEV